ncbi:8-amino-7-oxononanoate synthase [Pseudomonadota bacterium]|jgi:8-amino-7-oxononanoate synthase
MADFHARDLSQWLDARAAHRQAQYLGRHRRVLSGNHPVEVQADGGALLNFSSNDYLGLASHPDLVAALRSAADSHGVGSGASALVTGFRVEHQLLEQELAEFLQCEKVLLCSSGYLANLAVATSLTGRGDVIIQDKLCHASLIDAARLSEARLSRYGHVDMAGLQRRLASARQGNALVVSDGVFSMDGDTAPLKNMVDLCRQHQAWLAVDDAHGIGVCGPGGRGSVAAAGLNSLDVPILTGTLGKAFGCFGAFVAGSEKLINHLVNEARSYIYTTAMPPALAAAARAALRRVIEDEWRREHLQLLIRHFRQGARNRGLVLMDSDSPIQPMIIGDSRATLELAAALREQGYLVVAMRPPTVPKGTSRLRITLTAAHQAAQLDALLDAIKVATAHV